MTRRRRPPRGKYTRADLAPPKPPKREAYRAPRELCPKCSKTLTAGKFHDCGEQLPLPI